MKKHLIPFIIIFFLLLFPFAVGSAENSAGGTVTLSMEQLLQLMNLAKSSGGDPYSMEDVQQLVSLLGPVTGSSSPSSDEPLSCITHTAKIGEIRSCGTDDIDPEFSVKLIWQPRLATHISGIAASGTFVYIRAEICNLTDKTWDGLKPSSFKLIEDVASTGSRIEFPLHEQATYALNRSYEMNQISKEIYPGDTLSYLLAFDVSTQTANQQFIFRAVDRSGQKSLIRMVMPLPRYTWRLN